MAQTPTDQNFFHSHLQPHQHQPSHGQIPPTTTQTHNQPQHPPQMQMPPQFRNPYDLLYDERAGVNYNYIRPYVTHQVPPSEELNDSLVMRRPRRTRTTFTSAQIAELEQQFVHTKYLSASRLAELSAKLALGTAQVKIWFKNRRRRHKIQTDQQKEYLSTSLNGDAPMSISPSMPLMQENAARISCALLPPNIQSLNLGGGGGSAATAALTPSPTPSAAPASLMEPFGDAFNASSYYYNHTHPQHNMHATRVQTRGPPPPSAPPLLGLRQMSQPNAHPRPHMFTPQPHQQYPRLHPPASVPGASAAAASMATHYFAPPTTACQHQREPHMQKHLPYHEQRQHFHDYQPYKSALIGDSLISGFDERSMVVKDEPDFNFNNPYYLRMPDAAATATIATALNEPSAAECVASTPTAVSPNPNESTYEPLTPQNDESPCQSTSNNSASSSSSSASSINSNSSAGVAADHGMDDEQSTKTLQTLKPLSSRNNVATDNICGIGTGYSTIPGINTTLNNINMSECSGAFSKYTKLTAITNDTHESSSNYQCTMDTIMHTYNTHHTTTSSTQFAYCFN